MDPWARQLPCRVGPRNMKRWVSTACVCFPCISVSECLRPSQPNCHPEFETGCIVCISSPGFTCRGDCISERLSVLRWYLPWGPEFVHMPRNYESSSCWWVLVCLGCSTTIPRTRDEGACKQNLSLTVLGAESPRSRRWQIQRLARALFQIHRWLSPYFVLAL